MGNRDRLAATIKKWATELGLPLWQEDSYLRNLADRIEEAGLLAGEWVPMGLEVPKYGQGLILVYFETGEIEVWDTGRDEFVDGLEDLKDSNITYWAKLPQPPQADTGEKEKS